MNWSSIVQAILITLIQFLLPIALAALVAFINEKIKEVRKSQHKQEFDLAVAIVRQLVLAAEQQGLRGAIEAEGKAKKEYVLGLAEKALAERGITIDLHELDALVEAAVIDAFEHVDVQPAVETPAG